MWNFEAIFWFCALAGTGMLVIQFLLSLVGTDHDADLIEDGKFKWMTKQAATGFIMMLGWAGLTCREQFHLSILHTLLISLGAASLSAFITVLIFNLAKKAHSSGTVFKIEEAVGKEAIVYHRIPKSGTGKISVSLHNFTHEIDAISPYEEEIASFTQVQIIKQADDKTVVVIPLK
jgi:hypothetical protein